jgi:hypothetical protein
MDMIAWLALVSVLAMWIGVVLTTVTRIRLSRQAKHVAETVVDESQIRLQWASKALTKNRLLATLETDAAMTQYFKLVRKP